MKLYSRAQNSAGERVRIALNLKGISYDYAPVSSLAPGEYRRINPQGLMPTLEVDGQFIAQSGAILEFLEETYPAVPLLPEEPALRAQARAFGAHIAAEMHAITVNRVRVFLADKLHLDALGVQSWVHHWLTEGLQALEATLATRAGRTAFCFTDTPGWADLHLIPQLSNARRLGVDVRPFARLLAVEANCIGLGAFRLARPEAQPDYRPA